MTAELMVDRTDVGVFERVDELASAAHEQVVFCREESSGLRAIIGIHDTTLGPALGGTRYFPYVSEAAALTDVLRLSQGMTYKAAAAGLPLGGGKAVIIGDPARKKSAELLNAFGQFVDSLGGKYVTAADVGTTEEDLDIIGTATTHVVGRSKSAGGSGDSGFSTAYGVFCAMSAAAEYRWGATALEGRTVGVEGAGKVGFHLVGLLLEAGASVVLCDPDVHALERAKTHYPEIAVVASVIGTRVDVYAPCALGGTLFLETVAGLHAAIVCGAANNQLLTREVDTVLHQHEVLWVPDYIANAGGLIQVNGERTGKADGEVRADITKLSSTVAEVLATAQRSNITTGAAANEVVHGRLDRARNARSSS
jgi:valine dehydrogenase (NAD+)